MANWQTIEELKGIFIEKYLYSKLDSELEKACSEEYELKRDYNGRQILELLQNVDDAYVQTGNDTKNEVSVKIVFKDNILEVGNTGTAFSQETIERLCLGRASDKSSKNIGNKGTGFRSLLNDAEWIEVHSGDFSIRFSEQYAKKQFETYIDKSSSEFSSLIYRQYTEWKKEYPLCFPIMNCPEQIEKYPSEFDTLIRVKIKEDNKNKDAGILNQLNQPFYKSLLFLPNITKIEIAIDDEIKQFKKVCIGKRVFRLESESIGQEYYVDEKEANISGDKVAKLIIAVPIDDNYNFSNEKLYCYFPIRDFKTPVNALIHAPFLTNNSRDDVPNDNEQINKRIFEECLEFLKEIAEDLAKADGVAADLSVKTITPTNSFIGKVWDKEAFNLKAFYLDLLSDAKLLPTVNDDHISMSDKPKFFSYDFPEEFKGEPFKELLASLPEGVYSFVRNLAYSTGYYRLEYTTEELAERINSISDDLDISARVKIFLWWNDRFHSAKYIPHLLKDATGKWIEWGAKIYLPTDSGVSALPDSLSWVNLCVLHQSYVDELVTQLKSNYRARWDDARSKLTADSISNKRILDKVSDLYLSVKFIEQSTSYLVVEEINRQVDTNEKAVSFINWFYENYREKLRENPTRFDFDYRLPDRVGNLRATRVLFFGKEYGNELSEKIFDKSKCFAVADIETLFKAAENEKEEILAFLKLCGVRTYPQAYQSGSVVNNAAFVRYIKKKYGYDYNIYYASTMYIDGFEEALSALDTKEVIQWITNDNDLNNLILSYERTGYFSHKSNTYRNPLYANEYIRFALNRTKWIKKGDKKYSPNDIVKYPKLKDKVDGILGASERELIELLGKQVMHEMRLEFVDSLAAFPDNIIKSILLKLPEFDKGEISRALYEDIIRLKRDTYPTYSTDGLKLLAIDGNYYDNATVRYADRRLPKVASDEIHFIHIPTKRSTETIKNWLGVERYKINLEWVSSIERAPIVDFQQEISDTKIAVLAILDETNNYTAKTRSLKIIPCDSIRVRDVEKNNIEFDLDDYNYIKHEGKYFIKIPVSAGLERIRESLDYRTAVAEIFEDAVSPQIDTNQFEYLLLNNSDGKKAIIRNQYGIDKWNIIYDLLYHRKRVNELTIKFFRDNALNEQKLLNLKSVDFSNDISVEEYSILKGALIAIGKDVKDINSTDEQIEIDIRHCLKTEFSRYRDTQVDVYRFNCYSYAVENEQSQETFLDDCDKFRCYDLDIDSIQNSISINYEEILKNQFNNFDPSVDCKSVDIDEKYNDNYKLIINNGIARDELDMYLQTHTDVKSLLYFKVPENIAEDMKSFFKSESDENSYVAPQEFLTGNFSYGETSTINTTLSPTNNIPYNKPHIKSEKSQRQYEKESAAKENAGKKAEQIAYAELKKDHPNLIWHSKNSDVPADKNKGPVGIVCDMWCVNADNKKKYFEIKSATTEFEMSINEYNSMESAPDDYVVVLVDIGTGQISPHQFNELKNLKQVSKYRFCFTQIKI